MSEFRYRRRGEGWSKKVDISILFRLEKATARIKTLAERDKLTPILEEVEQLEVALDVAQGRVKNFDLKEHEMPEDENPAIYRDLPTK
ncbi:hypothetical protein BH10ACI1_BH10ACI1_17480 [soil metagenome]